MFIDHNSSRVPMFPSDTFNIVGCVHLFLIKLLGKLPAWGEKFRFSPSGKKIWIYSRLWGKEPSLILAHLCFQKQIFEMKKCSAGAMGIFFFHKTNCSKTSFLQKENLSKTGLRQPHNKRHALLGQLHRDFILSLDFVD